MKPISFTQTVHAHICLLSDLSLQEQHLLHTAARARQMAQAPYSKFYVGVAVLSKQGTVHQGCNVERCSWTQTTHAEQNAIDSMISQLGPAKIETVAIVGGHAQAAPVQFSDAPITTMPPLNQITMPCGHCLQIIWENCFQDTSVKLLSLTPQGHVFCTTIASALPFRFGPEALGINYNEYVTPSIKTETKSLQ